MLTQLLNNCGVELLPVVIPILVYWIYTSRKVQNELKGKVVLITGANSGLGEALAHVFYKAGCKLILAARRVDELERVRTDLLKSKTERETFEPVVLQLDLSKLETVPQKALEALSIHNQVDIIINNAGISHRGNISETSLEVHMNIMAVNYFGQIALTKALLPTLTKYKGHIVAISSIQGRIAIPYRSAYAASKHALQAYMDCLRSEISDIKVTVINAGYINTNLSINALTGTGNRHGVMDASTAKGYKADYVAQEILRAVLKEKKELTISPLGPKLAIYCRVLAPSLFFYVIKLWGKKKN